MSSTQETFQVAVEVAEAYEAHFVPAFFAQWAPMLLDAAGVATGHRVLDVACGTGILARTAVPRVGESGSVVGVDLNEAMLSVARRLRPDLDWLQGDAAALPFGDAEFDVVLSQMAMMFFPDPVAALREMRRVVRPGGSVGVLVPGALADNPPYQAFVDIVSRHAGVDARNLVTTYFVFGDLAGLVQLFTDAGLRVTATSRPVGESHFGSIDELINVEIDSTPLGDRLDLVDRERILADCRAALASYRQESGSVSFPFQCQLVIAQDCAKA